MSENLFPSWLFIYGPPGSGKSSLGWRLAEVLRLPFYDLDGVIETQAGTSIPEIFAAEGEPDFRQRENAALVAILNRPPGIVSLGGGALLKEENCKLVEATGSVLCLSAPFELLVSRLEAGTNRRPLLDGDARSLLNSLLEQRADHYASFPIQLDTSHYTTDEATWQAQVRTGMFRVRGMGMGYDVRVAVNSLDALGRALSGARMKEPVALVSDENVARHYLDRALCALHEAGYHTHPVIIPAGERFKTMDTIMFLWQEFLEAGVERGSTAIALGGGVVSDLVGFAAATYLRGVPWVVMPTSLLGMVDASLGGKTGVDLSRGKNLVGCFYPPYLVLVDPATLNTLPEPEACNGMAEVVKHGVLGDPSLFELCCQGWQSLHYEWDEIVRRAMAVKIGVIQADPYERGQRACLNLGHTLGHALELVSGYQLKHGEAIAIGMVAAVRLAERMEIAESGLTQVITNALQNLGLPTQIPSGLNREELLAAMQVDKKRADGKARLVLPLCIGAVKWGVEVEDLNLLIED